MAQTEQQEAFFEAVGEDLVPSVHAHSWWTPGMLHGPLLAGLAARSLERAYAAPGLHFTRLTVDLFRNAPMAPVRVVTRLARDGRRIRVADAVVEGAEGTVARVSAVLLRHGEQPAGEIPTTRPWDAPEPDELVVDERGPWSIWRFDGDNKPVTRWSDRSGRRAWLRQSRALVSGEALSPLVRVTIAADSASPLAHSGDQGLRFINADYTLCLSRLPLSDAIGLESSGHLSEEGVAVGHCTLHDTAGPIGFCMTTAVANPRPPRV